MAMFQFSARQVELNFCDQIKCTVPLTDEVQKKVQDAAKELLRVSQAAKDSDNKEHTLDELCDSVMDAIDEILGEGMSDQILGMKEGYTFWDACDVFKYITDEINTAMHGVAASYASKPPITPVNRAQRRAKHKRHGT